MDSLDNGAGADFGDGGNSFGGSVEANGSAAGIGGGNSIGSGGLSNGSGDSGLGNASSFGGPGGAVVDLSGSTPGVDANAVAAAFADVASGLAALGASNPIGALGLAHAFLSLSPQVQLGVASTISSDPNVAAQQLAAFTQY